MSDTDEDVFESLNSLKQLLGESYVYEESEAESARASSEGSESEDRSSEAEEESEPDLEQQPGYSLYVDSLHGIDEPAVGSNLLHVASGTSAHLRGTQKWLAAKRFQVQRLREACASRDTHLEKLAGIGASQAVPCPTRPAHQLQLTVKTQAERAVEANLKLQQQLMRSLRDLEAAAKENADVAAQLTTAIAGANSVRRANRLARDGRETGGAVGFWNAGPDRPNAHPDAIRLQQALRWLPPRPHVKAWTPQEDGRLKHAVLRLAREIKFGGKLKELEEVASSGGDLSVHTIQEMRHAVEAMLHDTQEVDEFGISMTEETWQRAWQGAGLSSHSPTDCQLRWLHHCRPGLTQDSWTADENSQLLDLTQQHGLYAWGKIARDMGGRRTAAACLSHYQRDLSSHERQQKLWSIAEDQELARLVKQYGLQSWAVIKNSMPGRTGNQCKHHWTTIKPGSKKGPWSAEEDTALLEAVQAHGRSWTKVAPHVAGRTQQAVRERYVNHLDPGKKPTGKWDATEDALLRERVPLCLDKEGKIRWAEVARGIPSRTDSDCSRRWKQIEAKGKAGLTHKRKRQRQCPDVNESASDTDASDQDQQHLEASAKSSRQGTTERGKRKARSSAAQHTNTSSPHMDVERLQPVPLSPI
ncbi:hypothetical protein WJX84_002392 [Apatococcus fuscideae]|uniref:Uncharacterized protein n=1 Tax=Apatococcus fuscideae TaxID=2026836 RepID=A0AAW1T4H6_9CHLO